jgi:hypothetical protein
MVRRISGYVKIIFLLMALSGGGNAQNQPGNWKRDRKIAILFGLTQPVIASGFNIEGNFIYNRLIFDYSHGVSLDFTGDLLAPDLKDQGVAVHLPWTTGFGAGYRFTAWLNLRAEPKWHRFEFYYKGEAQTKSNQIVAYNTFTLGMGLYGFFQPFKRKDNFLNGLTIAPSIRFWPTVSSTLKGDRFDYANKNTGDTEQIKTLDPGVGFTPLIVNISVGYCFQIKR